MSDFILFQLPLGLFLLYSTIWCMYAVAFLLRRSRKPIVNNDPKPLVTVVVPFRNEQNRLPRLIKCLELQYLHQPVEYLFIDDHSTDASVQQIDKSQLHNLRILHLTTETGKKAALYKAAQEANGEYIICTDADCSVGPHWLQTITDTIISSKADFAFGPVRIDHSKHWFEQWQALEFMSLVASSAGSACLGWSIMCSAANMAFKRSVFKELNDPLSIKIASGDDMFLLHSMKKAGKRIEYIKNIRAVVNTPAQKNWHSFIHQRIRWTSKGRFYRDADTLFIGVMVFLVNLILFLGLLYSAYDHLYTYFWLMLFVIKSTADLLLLAPFARWSGQRDLLKWFFPVQVLYIFYVSFTAIYGSLTSFKWKDRNLHG